MTTKPSHLKIGLAATVFILVAYFGVIIFGDNGLLDLNRKKERLYTIQAKNKAIENKSINLYRKLDRLTKDTNYLEYIIRQELCFVGEDEIVFRFDSEK